MKRVLDELADALSAAHGHPCPRRIAGTVGLPGQFGLPITPSRWAALEQRLACSLPPLQRRGDGLWSFPRGWTTVWDLADYLAERRPGWGFPSGRELADWREAQIFVCVRDLLVEALNVSPEQVVRSARLMEDLGAE
jgi:hypothetical protein